MGSRDRSIIQTNPQLRALMPSLKEIAARRAASKKQESPAQESGGLTLRESATKPPVMQDAPAPRYQEERELYSPDGERVPMAFPNRHQEPREYAWHLVATAFESEFGVVDDPKDPNVRWLAVQRTDMAGATILIQKLPRLHWPKPNEPF